MAKKAKQQDNPEIEILKAQLARTLADYDNLQKRTERQSFELYANASQRIVRQLLPILDMLNDAQKHLNDAGLAITIKEFEDVLKNEGYEKITPEAETLFDPNIHEVIDVVETDKSDEDNKITNVSLSGWTQGENIIRPAKVIVKKLIQN